MAERIYVAVYDRKPLSEMEKLSPSDLLDYACKLQVEVEHWYGLASTCADERDKAEHEVADLRAHRLDAFACAALPALIYRTSDERIAIRAWEIADAMEQERAARLQRASEEPK